MAARNLYMRTTISTRKPGHDWHSYTRAEMHDLQHTERLRNEPTTTGVLHFDADGKRIPSTPYKPRTWDDLAAALPRNSSPSPARKSYS